MDEKTIQLIRDMAAQLGTTSEKLWAVMVTGVKVSGIANILVAVVGLVVGIVAVKIVLKLMRSEDYGDASDDGIIPFWLMATAVISGTVSLAFTYKAFMCLFAPEYVALMRIVSAVSN